MPRDLSYPPRLHQSLTWAPVRPKHGHPRPACKDAERPSRPPSRPADAEPRCGPGGSPAAMLSGTGVQTWVGDLNAPLLPNCVPLTENSVAQSVQSKHSRFHHFLAAARGVALSPLEPLGKRGLVPDRMQDPLNAGLGDRHPAPPGLDPSMAGDVPRCSRPRLPTPEEAARGGRPSRPRCPPAPIVRGLLIVPRGRAGRG